MRCPEPCWRVTVKIPISQTVRHCRWLRLPLKPKLESLHPTAETGEVSSATVAAESEASSANNILAFNDSPPIEKAKPALQEPALQDQDATTADQTSTETGGAVPFTKTQNSKELYAAKPSSATERAFAGNSAWIIKSGVLHRSSDNGLNWQEALRGEHPLLCYLNRGTDVWAGGQAGTLFHSADGGLNWSRVQPSVGFLALTSDITSIAAIGVSAIEFLPVRASGGPPWTVAKPGQRSNSLFLSHLQMDIAIGALKLVTFGHVQWYFFSSFIITKVTFTLWPNGHRISR